MPRRFNMLEGQVRNLLKQYMPVSYTHLVLGMNPDHAGNTIIEADVPQLEIYGYSTTLRSMTGGSGDFSYEFARYEQAPNDIQAKEIEARASKLDTTE